MMHLLHIVHMLPLCRQFVRDTRGATAIEYGLIAALVAVAAVGTMSTVGTKLRNTFTNVSNNLRVA